MTEPDHLCAAAGKEKSVTSRVAAFLAFPIRFGLYEGLGDAKLFPNGNRSYWSA